MSFSQPDVTSTNPPEKTITLVYETKANPPFYFAQDDKAENNLPGASLELFDLVAHNLGIKFQYSRRPWARALEELKANEFDGVFNASFNEERKAYGVFPMEEGLPDTSRQTIDLSYVFYKRKDQAISWNGIRLRNFNGIIGTIFGYSINDDLKALGLKLDPVASQLINLKKLALGRIDLVADIETMNDGFIANDASLNNIIKLTPPIKTKAYYLMFSHDFYATNTELANSIWDEIRLIRQTDQFNQILTKYY